LNVRAEDPDHGLVQVSAPITVVVSAGQIGTSNTGLFSGTTLLIVGLIGAAIVVGFVALLVNAKRKSANYVECGNCGRPAREGDRKCPSCGVEFEEDIAKCSHCASWIPANASRCPKCNTEFKPIDEAITAKAEAAEQAPVEEARAEVTTPATPVKAPVAVKKKVLKTAEPAAPAGKKDEFANPWEQPETQQAPAQAPAQPKPAEKKPEEKKEKGLFDDL
jgi:RNA polymerase subunit RPABC4/transcription elongation factor Spt4